MAPVIRAFRADPRFRTLVCVTGQHRAMLDQVLDFFAIRPDHDLNLMSANQRLSTLAGRAIMGCAEVIEQARPAIVFVQGDTTTTFAAAFAAFQARVPVAHIEAGLRSFQKFAPFPEEINRVLASHVADLHFAPLESSRANLEREGIRQNVFVVGNTVVDALLLGLDLIRQRGEQRLAKAFSRVDFSRKLVLATVHRRESFGKPLEEICQGLHDVAAEPNVEILFAVHLNPNVYKVVHRVLGGHSKIHLVEPLDYAHFIWAMSKASLIITDSGGVQEEAPSLGVPVLVVREVTERPEGVAAGCARLVGFDRNRILVEARTALAKPPGSGSPANPYGDGHASARILEHTACFLSQQ